MMKNLMEYRGCHTKIELDVESMSLRGKIEGIDDYIDFEAADIVGIEEEFHAAVDDYLEFCIEVGKEPEKEYKWTFNVRIAPELNKKLVLRAFKDGCSLNSEVKAAIAAFVDNNQLQTRALADSVRHFKEDEEGCENMCEAVEQYGDRRAERERLSSVKKLMKNMKWTLEQALNALGIQGDERDTIAKIIMEQWWIWGEEITRGVKKLINWQRMGLFEHDVYRDQYQSFDEAMRSVYVSPYGEDPFEFIQMLDREFDLKKMYPNINKIQYTEMDLTSLATEYMSRMCDVVRKL